ncbi:hypothetical protein [Pseudonocardia sp. WMMC193]|uniref:hypothetical protein n=1 Tax=Pseudonocardia sp. WMMC193 TaxID=2911965 RepID=UPI001F2B3B2F|nr:hypothetical protein [Pseudonocardia sp. WMMC193]MCF7552378.1 hypothetical protein [Pseudonocardia sp. WMMC193]
MDDPRTEPTAPTGPAALTAAQRIAIALGTADPDNVPDAEPDAEQEADPPGSPG